MATETGTLTKTYLLVSELSLPRVDPIFLIAEHQSLAEGTKVGYLRVMRDYLESGGDLLDAEALASYAAGLSQSGQAAMKAAVKLWVDRMTFVINNRELDWMRRVDDPLRLDAFVNAFLRKLKALTVAIRSPEIKGSQTHIWLARTQVRGLYIATEEIGGIEGQRDRVALGLMLAAGLRRQEAVELEFKQIKLQPVGERIRTVLAVKGKGAKRRTVPVSDKFAAILDGWGAEIGAEGRVLRALGRERVVKKSISAVAVFQMVRRYGKRIGVPELACHDLRRTYAQLGYQAGVAATQVSILLGHANLATTQRYLNLDVDLEATSSDFIPWG